MITMIASAILELPLMGALVFMDISTPLSTLPYHPLFLIIAAAYPIVLLVWRSFPASWKYNPEPLRYTFALWATAALGVIGGMVWVWWWGETGSLAVRLPGRLAFTFLAICLMMSPINTLTHRRYEPILLMLRKTFGVVSLLFFLAHAFRFSLMMTGFAPAWASIIEIAGFLWSGTISSRMTLIGLIAGIGMILLGATSNTASYRLLGRHWKTLHRLVYPIFVLSILHVVWAERFSGYYTFLLASVTILRAWSFVINRKSKVSVPKGRATKYLCLVCGYIYDEALGDPDSGIAPGTRWEDIPDTWYCPICKVGKKDFEPYYDNSSEVDSTVRAEVISAKLLTPDVIELIIRTTTQIETIPGQFFRFVLSDLDGDFERSYSVAHEDWNIVTFLIRIKPDGRAGKIWKRVREGDLMKIARTGGAFVLRDTMNPKVFIATGTGLAPIYRMIRSLPSETTKTLYFGVRDHSDLCYEEKLCAIPSLIIHIFLSREQVAWYGFGRIDTSAIEASADTEFYICGGPAMTEEVTKVLQGRGFEHVYSEAFE